ncbi:MAG: hypothetical protein GY862_23440 [Gammaproteobacteria bacterium]|nr:hypothetical protein [Gammaproteobacteria bacterium]
MYEVRFYKGDYKQRQQQANLEGCVAYVEQHFNSSASLDSNYSVVITGRNASATSKNWGRWYAQAVCAEFGTPTASGTDGILVGGFNGRGDSNLRYTRMPAILLEPLFASNPQHAEWIRSKSGQLRLATILVESLQRFFPEGGLIGFSVGHKYKTSRPNDRGAPLFGGGLEADYAELVMAEAKRKLEGGADEEIPDRAIRVMQDGEVLWEHAVDEDDYIDWDPVRGVLRIGN